jgi:hypothetical protein
MIIFFHEEPEDCELWIADCGLCVDPAGGLRIADCVRRSPAKADCELRIADWGLLEPVTSKHNIVSPLLRAPCNVHAHP